MDPDAELTAHAMEVLGLLDTRAAPLDRDGPRCRRVRKIRAAKFGADHLQVAQGLSRQAHALGDSGRYAEAGLLDRRALAIREAKLGPDDPEVAEALDRLAIATEHPGRFAAAGRFDRRNLESREGTSVPTTPSTDRDGRAGPGPDDRHSDDGDGAGLALGVHNRIAEFFEGRVGRRADGRAEWERSEAVAGAREGRSSRGGSPR